jgi:hypothetical protein
MKRIFACFAFAFTVVAGRATEPLLDNPITVPITYYVEGVSNNTSFASASFGLELGSTSGFIQYSPIFTGYYYSTPSTAFVIPGKKYTVTMSGSGLFTANIHFVKSPGCDIYLDGVKRTVASKGPPSWTIDVRVDKINDITDSLSGKRGGRSVIFCGG